MADTIKRKAPRSRLGPLDFGMAALLAAAVAFVTLAVPDGLLPVGAPAGGLLRIGLAGGAAAATFLLVAALLAALNAPRPRRAGTRKEVAAQPPRLRRADAHPDAPSRSPILAGRELGVPLDELPIDERPAADLAEVENVDFDAEWERPLPDFIEEEGAEPETADWEPVAADPQEPAAAPAPAPGEADRPTAADIPFWVPEGAAEPVREVPTDRADTGEPAPAVPFPAARARSPRSRGSASLQQLAEQLPASEEQGDLGAMVSQLETGLTRCQPGADHELDQRLREALGDLKKMSGKG